MTVNPRCLHVSRVHPSLGVQQVRCAAGEALLTIGAQQALNTMAEGLAQEEQGVLTQEARLVWHTLQEMLQSPYPQTAPLKAFLVNLEKGLESYELDMA